MVIKLLVLVIVLFAIGLNCLNVKRRRKNPTYYVDKANILEDDLEDTLAEKYFEFVQPAYLRHIHQVHGGTSANPDAPNSLNTKNPLVGNEENTIWSSIGSISALDDGTGKYEASNLTLDTVYVPIIIYYLQLSAIVFLLFYLLVRLQIFNYFFHSRLLLCFNNLSCLCFFLSNGQSLLATKTSITSFENQVSAGDKVIFITTPDHNMFQR